MKKKVLLLIFILLTFKTQLNAEVATRENVIKLYVATFNRAADPGGLDYWVNTSGLSLEDIAKSFFDQEETQALYPSNYNTVDFITAIYQNLFKRNPEPAGSAYWKEELDSERISKSVFILAVVNGAQGDDATILANKTEVATKFVEANINDLNLSKSIMTNITSDYQTVTDALANLNGNTLDVKDEPYYKYSWHINAQNSALNIEGYGIDNDADINIEEAWKTTMGKGVIVAVIDDGADLEHEDLKTNILSAYNSVSRDSSAQYEGTEQYPSSHGNACAGLIVAPINGKGIVGIAPESKVIVISGVFHQDATEATWIHAFEYAKSLGAKVISCSWGSNSVSDAFKAEMKSLYDANITVLFASGNDGLNLDTEGVDDESKIEWVIGVGASGENNDVTPYSNYGKDIDVLAPGGDASESSGILTLDDMGEKGDSSIQLGLVNNNYGFTNGTSFATPVTAGVVALMYAVNPNITPAQVKSILIQTADKIGIDTGASYNNEGFDTKRAYGKINAAKAVAEAKKLVD